MLVLLNPEKPTLLFCRRQPSRPNRCCGRLTAVGIAHPPEDWPGACGEAALVGDDATPTPRVARATHVIWRLNNADSDVLLRSSARKYLSRIVPLSAKGMVEEIFIATGT